VNEAYKTSKMKLQFTIIHSHCSVSVVHVMVFWVVTLCNDVVW